MSQVLIVVFDGLQPAQVIPQLMPNLAGWAGEGVTFARNHPVFPTVTRANAASLVTGSYPGVHGLAANNMVFPEYDPYQAVAVLQPNLAAIAESGHKILLAPTLADILSQQGQEYVAIGVGTSGNAYVHIPWLPKAAARPSIPSLLCRPTFMANCWSDSVPGPRKPFPTRPAWLML